MVNESNPLRGSCHCGNLSLSFFTTLPPTSFNPRACDCSFCSKHAAMYVSDPSGRLIINVRDSNGLGKYQQGSQTIDLIFCRNCGVLVAAICEKEGTILGTINARCLDEYEGFGEPVVVSPQTLSKEEKTTRWDAIWIKEVQLNVDNKYSCL